MMSRLYSDMDFPPNLLSTSDTNLNYHCQIHLSLTFGPLLEIIVTVALMILCVSFLKSNPGLDCLLDHSQVLVLVPVLALRVWDGRTGNRLHIRKVVSGRMANSWGWETWMSRSPHRKLQGCWWVNDSLDLHGKCWNTSCLNHPRLSYPYSSNQLIPFHLSNFL